MDTIRFKYRLIDTQGNRKGFLARKGSLSSEAGLALKEGTFPSDAIGRARVHTGSIVLLEFADAAIALEVYGGKAKRLVRSLNAMASAHHAEAAREQLFQRGAGHDFRSATCPHCSSTIDLSRLPSSPQLYCPYCETLSEGGAVDRELARYRVCGGCGYFAEPRSFTEFYFYWLVFVFGFRWNRHELCSSCMRGTAWKMLICNSIFVLGVPVALSQLWRAYFGGSHSSPLFPSIEAANLAARAGRREQAEDMYQRIVAGTTRAPGVHYNRALASLGADDFNAADACLQQSLRECANYVPAFEVLRRLCEHTEQLDRRRALDAMWGVEEEAAGAEASDATPDERLEAAP